MDGGLSMEYSQLVLDTYEENLNTVELDVF